MADGTRGDRHAAPASSSRPSTLNIINRRAARRNGIVSLFRDQVVTIESEEYRVVAPIIVHAVDKRALESVRELLGPLSTEDWLLLLARNVPGTDTFKLSVQLPSRVTSARNPGGDGPLSREDEAAFGTPVGREGCYEWLVSLLHDTGSFDAARLQHFTEFRAAIRAARRAARAKPPDPAKAAGLAATPEPGGGPAETPLELGSTVHWRAGTVARKGIIQSVECEDPLVYVVLVGAKRQQRLAWRAGGRRLRHRGCWVRAWHRVGGAGRRLR